MFAHSDKIQAVWDELSPKCDDMLSDSADSSCTTGYDNDGSTGFEIFENGYSLGKRAGDKAVWYVRDDDSAWFFIGTEDEVCAALRTFADELQKDTRPPGVVHDWPPKDGS